MNTKNESKSESSCELASASVSTAMEIELLSEPVTPSAPTQDSNEQDTPAPRVSRTPLSEEHAQSVTPNEYKIVEAVGSGGMGVVYKARHSALDKTLAVKLLHPKLVFDQANVQRFQQEAKAACMLTHPNLVAVYDHGISADGEPYLVMDYVNGESLADVIAREHGLEVPRFISIFLQVCDALGHAHGKQVIHRDIKPGNIMLSTSEEKKDFVKLLDFGIAKLLPTANTDEQRLTQTGELLGSPVYMSPEQCLGDGLDARSDIYSLGCVMYEALTGKPPFLGDNIVQTILKHLNEEPLSLIAAKRSLMIPEQLEKIIFKCLKKTPSERYQSIEELRDALESLDQEISPERKKILAKKLLRLGLREFLKQFERKIFLLAFSVCFVALASVRVYANCMSDLKLQEYINSAAMLEASNDVAEEIPKACTDYWQKAVVEAKRIMKPPAVIASLQLLQAGTIARRFNGYSQSGNTHRFDMEDNQQQEAALSEIESALKFFESQTPANVATIPLFDKLILCRQGTRDLALLQQNHEKVHAAIAAAEWRKAFDLVIGAKYLFPADSYMHEHLFEALSGVLSEIKADRAENALFLSQQALFVDGRYHHIPSQADLRATTGLIADYHKYLKLLHLAGDSAEHHKMLALKAIDAGQLEAAGFEVEITAGQDWRLHALRDDYVRELDWLQDKEIERKVKAPDLPLYERQLAFEKKCLLPTSKKFYATKADIAEAAHGGGDFIKAEKFYRELLAAPRPAFLNAELVSAELGELLRVQGRYDEAEKVEEELKEKPGFLLPRLRLLASAKKQPELAQEARQLFDRLERYERPASSEKTQWCVF